MQHIREKPAPGARIDYSHPLARGLVGCWLMNETGQRVFDSSPYKNHGVLSGFDSPPKRSSQGIVFDGVNDYVNVGNAISLNPSQVTVEAWVKPVSANMVSYARIVEKWYSNSYYLGFDTTGTKFKGIFVRPPDPYGTLESTTTISAGTWYHVVITHDGANDYLYVNGVQESTEANTAVCDNTAHNVLIGRASFEVTTHFSGSNDEVRIYNRALSANEVKQLYINPYDMFKSKTTTYV